VTQQETDGGPCDLRQPRSIRAAFIEGASASQRLQAVSTDNGSEVRSGEFRSAAKDVSADHRFIAVGPRPNGRVERVQRTVLEECSRPTFARALVPKYTTLRRDLERYIAYFNLDRAHLGRYTKDRAPGEVVYGSRKMHPS